MILTLPFKNCTKDDITQIFHSDHKAWDLVENSTARGSLYGTPLCAPENCTVLGITSEALSHDNTSLEKGYGIRLLGQETSMEYLFWHCLPIFPVNGGDSVKRGGIVGYMGNSGYVVVGGKTVPLEERLNDPENGTHLHLVVFKDKKEVDPMLYFNWNWQPQWTLADYISALILTLQKKVKLLSK